MEWIIQKCVELGVHAIVPVATKRAVVKLDEKKAQKSEQMECHRRECGEAVRKRDPGKFPVMKWKEALEPCRWMLR